MSETLSERLAKLAGWTRRDSHWWSPDGHAYGAPPAYEHSIDAQIRDLDPLVEAKWGKFAEHRGSLECTVEDFWRTKRAQGYGPTRASARAAALEAALEEK